MPRHARSRHAAFPALIVLAAVAGCAGPQSSSSRTSSAILKSCRASADSSFNRQNRYLLSERDEKDSPFSRSFVAGDTSRGLPSTYAYDTQLSDCLASSKIPQNPDQPATSTQPLPGLGSKIVPY